MNKFIFIFVMSALLFGITPFSLQAQVPSPTLFGNLGGKIIKIDFCTCSFGLMLTIATAPLGIPVNVFYEPFYSRLNMNYNPFLLGNNVILQHSGVPVPCQKYAVFACYADGMAVGTITTFPFAGIGTSATPLIKVEKTEYPVAY